MEDLTKFAAGSMDKGLAQYSSDFDAEVTFKLPMGNVSAGGIHQGAGVRYGNAPIPGHADAEPTTGSPSGALNGLRAAELFTGDGLVRRVKVYGIIQLRLGGYEDLQARNDYYAYLVSRIATGDGFEYFDIILGSISNASDNTYRHNPNITAGLHPLSSAAPSGRGYYEAGYEVLGELLRHETSGDYVNILKAYLKTNNSNYASFADFSFSGFDVPNNYLLGTALSAPDATHAPDVNFNLNTWLGGTTRFSNPCSGGVPSPFQFNKYLNGHNRVVIVYGMLSTGFPLAAWKVKINTTLYGPARNYDLTNKNIDFSSASGTTSLIFKTGAAPYSDIIGALIVDKFSTINNSYKAILAANLGSAFCAIFQEWHRNTDGPLVQWIDLTQNSIEPPLITNGTYNESTIPVPSCFQSWPDFTLGVLMAGPYANGPALGDAGSGIFRAGTVYEFTYSHYYKRLNYESNVGKPVKFQVGTSDFVKLIILQPLTVGGNAISGAAGQPMPAVSFIDPNFLSINFVEYRFYYRALGTFEWLPCGNIDAPQYWADPSICAIPSPTHYGFAVGATPVAGPTGGQPGGFNDYSPLPDDQYTCVVVFKNRAFWFSDKAISFSNKNNIFAYSGRNSIAATSGKFKGGLVHNYPGQAEQNSRLIIFGTNETYVGRFSGQPLQQSIQVSPDSVGTFDVDGTDFVIDPWTSVTAFSHRAAVVAEGILYFWGPRGIYVDGGVDTPDRISGPLEPDIFTLYDPGKTDEIHAVYNQTTHEITWFYPPNEDDGNPTHALVFNVRTEKFYPLQFQSKIDSAFNLEITTNGIKTAGQRCLLTVREAEGAGYVPQRAYFYDQNNRSGDMRPNYDMMVKSFTTPSAGQRRLELAAGYSAANLLNIAIGDLICLDQLKRYASTLTLAEDMIATVTDRDVDAGTIDIQLPDGAELDDAATLAHRDYFPIWHMTPDGVGMNGIAWVMFTNYWMPGGVNFSGYWEHLYMLFKTELLKSVDPQTFLVEYRTPVSTDFVGDRIAFVDNSDGNMQVYHNNRLGERAMEGQAIKLRLSGIHIGSKWVLQYLEAHASDISKDSDFLKEFEG